MFLYISWGEACFESHMICLITIFLLYKSMFIIIKKGEVFDLTQNLIYLITNLIIYLETKNDSQTITKEPNNII